jgi:hypothetical protein
MCIVSGPASQDVVIKAYMLRRVYSVHSFPAEYSFKNLKGPRTLKAQSSKI